MPKSSAHEAHTNTRLLVAFIVALFFGPLLRPISAQSSNTDSETTIESAIDAWLLAREWVDDLQVPSAENAPVLPKLKAPAISICLRFRGRIIGVGDDATGTSSALLNAATRAVRDARRKEQVRALPLGMIEAVGRNTTMELEFARTPTLLLGDSFDALVREIRPGIDGVAVRRGTQWRFSFPARMQAFGLADRPDRVIVRLLRELNLPPREPGVLRRNEQIEFYRFSVLSLTQETPDGFPFEAIRGQRSVHNTDELEGRALSLAQLAIEHLLAHEIVDSDVEEATAPDTMQLKALGLFGDYDFVRNEFDPLVAPPADQALAAWALGRAANKIAALPAETAEQLRVVAARVLDRLAMIDAVEASPLDDRRAVALLVLAANESQPTTDAGNALVARAHTQLRAAIAASTKDTLLLPVELLAAAVSCPENHAQLRSQLEQLWRDTPKSSLLGSLQFLLLAEAALADRDDEQPNTVTRLEMASIVIDAAIANQIGHEDSLLAPVDPAGDLAGGFVLSGATRPTATSASIRLASGLAAMRQFKESTEAHERALALALRFVTQLQVRDDSLCRAQFPTRARGGIRSAPWSHSLRLSDTAGALLFATEFLLGFAN